MILKIKFSTFTMHPLSMHLFRQSLLVTCQISFIRQDCQPDIFLRMSDPICLSVFLHHSHHYFLLLELQFDGLPSVFVLSEQDALACVISVKGRKQPFLAPTAVDKNAVSSAGACSPYRALMPGHLSPATSGSRPDDAATTVYQCTFGNDHYHILIRNNQNVLSQSPRQHVQHPGYSQSHI